MKNWYEQKEYGVSAWKLNFLSTVYRVFGKSVLRIFLYPIVYFYWCFSKKSRQASENFIRIINSYLSSKCLCSCDFSSYQHMLFYAESLFDKFIAFSGGKLPITFVQNESYKDFSNVIAENRGCFLICSHHGNIEALPAIIHANNKNIFNKCIHAFMQVSQSPVFHDFIQQNTNVSQVIIHATENIGISTGIEISDLLENGNLVMMAGDRLNSSMSGISVNILGRQCLLPRGVFKLAKFTDVPIFFISCIKMNGKYLVELKKGRGNINELALQFSEFLEKQIIKTPINWANFYDFFNLEFQNS